MKYLLNKLLVVFLLGTLFACSDDSESIQKSSPYEDETSEWNASLPVLDVSKAHRVLCIGNSITLHMENEKARWYSRHGMAASAPELDYVHQLQTMLRESNDSTEVLPKNIGEWELNPTLNLDSILSESMEGVDVVVVRLGENMISGQSQASYEAAYDSIFAYCKRHADFVMTTGQYWGNKDKEQGCWKAAQKNEIRMAKIDWIFDLGDEVAPKVGDMIQGYDLEMYPITTEFVCTHPNDKGMAMIAEEIYETMVGKKYSASKD